MAKQRYGIPYTLDSSYMDMEIALQTNSGVGLRPFPVKNILLVLAGIMGGYLLLAKSFISQGTGFQKFIFVVAWVAICFLALTTDRTKQMGLTKILSVFNFLQPNNRYINTRLVSNADDFARLVGFDNIDNDGTIHYYDKSLGQVFDIIGNGSNLLFESHKEAIIDQTDAHYRKMKPKTSYQYITTTEAQNVYLQVASVMERKKNLTVSDPDLDAMLDTDLYVLNKIVGQSFKSLHQYLIIQAPDKDEFEAALNIFWAEAESTSLMFKYAEQLDTEEAAEFYKHIYCAPDQH